MLSVCPPLCRVGVLLFVTYLEGRRKNVILGVRKIKPIDIIAAMFVLSETVVFPLIQFTPGDVSAFWSYVAIVLVVLMSLATFKGLGTDSLIRLGLLFTLVADYFLVLDGEKLLEGVAAFIVVQACYFAYLFLGEENGTLRIANVLSRAATSVMLVVLTFVVLGEDTDALAIASVLYYANLVLNTVFAFLHGRRERIFAVGLALFCMCDLCIGLEVLFSSYLNSDALDFFYGANLNLPWVFYQPSQVLIALSLYYKNGIKSRA